MNCIIVMLKRDIDVHLCAVALICVNLLLIDTCVHPFTMPLKIVVKYANKEINRSVGIIIFETSVRVYTVYIKDNFIIALFSD